MVTVTSVYIYGYSSGTVVGTTSPLFTFNPVPPAVSFSMDNSVGKMEMDLPSFRRPQNFFTSSSKRKLTIRAVLVGKNIIPSGSTILNQLDTLMSIMSGNAADYYQIVVPFNENFSGTPTAYTTADSDKDNAMFSTGSNYMMFFGHPDNFTIEKVTRNACYVSLSFTEVSDSFNIA